MNKDTLQQQIINYLSPTDYNYPVFPSFPDESYQPTGIAVVSIPTITQEHPGVNDYAVELVVDIQSQFDYDPQFQRQKEISNILIAKLEQIPKLSISFPDLVGSSPLSITAEDTEEAKLTTITMTLYYSFD